MPSQALIALDAAPGDPRLDSAPATRWSTMREVVALVGRDLGRSPLRSADALADRRHGIDQLFEAAAVVDGGRAEPDGERDTPGVGDQVALGACSAADLNRSDWDRSPRPPFGRNIGAVHASTAPVDGRGATQAVKQNATEPFPDTGRLPGPLASRAAASRSCPTRTPSLGEALPEYAALEHKQNATQRRPVRDQRPTAFRLRPLRRQQRFDQYP